MARILKFVASISVGIVFIGFWLFLLFNAETFVKVNVETFRDTMYKYIIATTLVFSLDTYSRYKTERGLFSLSLVKGLPKYLAVFTVVLIGLRLGGGLIRGVNFPSILTLLSADFVPIIIAHALIISVSEELIFRGFFTRELLSMKLRLWQVAIITSIAFGIFHWSVDYGSWASIGVHSLMGLGFFYVNWYGLPLFNKIPKIGEKYFGSSRDTTVTSSATHSAWNLFVLGFLR